MNKKSKRRNTIIFCVFGVLVLAGVLYYVFAGSAFYKNPKNFVGNSAGNLANSGLFCEYEGVVYFANPSDGGSLYSMTPDGKNLKKINDVGVHYINTDGTRIYYSLSGDSSGSGLGFIRNSTGMVSVKMNGTNSINYTQDPVGAVALIGNYLYFQHYRKTSGTTLDKIPIEKAEIETVIEDMVTPASADNGIIYYAGYSKDHILYTLDTNTDTSTELYNHQMISPIYYNGSIYYIDLESNYHLHRYTPATREDIEIVSERVEFFNVTGNMIYYQNDSSTQNPELRRVMIDGSSNELVASGIYKDINVTSQYVYFHEYRSISPMYKQSINGPVAVSTFNPGTAER